MSTFTPAEAAACERLVALALAEDLGDACDRTSLALIPPDRPGRAALVARTVGVLAGLPAVQMVCGRVDVRLKLEPLLADGTALKPGDRIAVLAGPVRALLAAERTALNFLQRLSGVATQTRRYAELVADLPVQVLDTRKTTPGWRLLEKYAVRQGGGHNHRLGLFDGILIKDNHLAALPPCDRPVAEAVRRARAAATGLPIEVEVDTLAQLDEALTERPDIVLLDNMKPDLLRAAVAKRNAASPQTLLEASGGVTIATLRMIAETGVDRISIGALTHSAVALDISLDYEP
jgi:nicotinate-nucleotide pyrophosphorylase (carboxylating)